MSTDPLALATGGLFDGQSLGAATQGLALAGTHARARIRQHITDRLKLATTAADRVFASRKLPYPAAKLRTVGPILLVHTGNDTPEGMVSVSPPIYRKILEVHVDCCASMAPKLDPLDLLDAIALAVEAVVLQDETQGGFAVETRLGATAPSLDDDGQEVVAVTRVTFEIEYHAETAVDPVADDLETIHTKWDLAPPDGELEAEDHLELQP